jgi:hypothetical protein
MTLKYRTKTLEPSGRYPMKVVTYKTSFYSYVRMGGERKENIEEGLFDPSEHETFTRQGVQYFIHSPYEMFSRESASHQTIVNHSMIVYLNPQKTIIDEALESYPPERLV